jgi:hypothetical protein
MVPRILRPLLRCAVAALAVVSGFCAEDELPRRTNEGDGVKLAETQEKRTQTTPEPPVEQWPVKPLRGYSRNREKISAAIFDLLEDISIIDIGVGKGSLKLKAGRKIYDNHDVLGSWTVIDRFRLGYKYPLYEYLNPFGSGFFFGFRVDGLVETDFLDIRQVLPSQYDEMQKPEQRFAELESSNWFRNFLHNGDKSDESRALVDMNRSELNPPNRSPSGRESTFRAFDGLTRARYSRLWNMISFPGRIPFKSEWISHIQQGEIISYAGRGKVELGPSVGWSIDLTGITNILKAELSLRTWLIGQFRISIYREDERYVQVKLNRQATLGGGTSFDSGTDDVVVGFLSFESRLHRTDITPFSFGLSKARTRSFDVVYRYDLTDESARAAFDKATRGRFGDSDDLAGGLDWQTVEKPRAVTKVGMRDTVADRIGKVSETRLAFLYRHKHVADLTHSDIVITLEDGSTRVFRSVARNSKMWRWVWGDQEQADHDYRISVNLDRFEAEMPDAITLTVNGDIADSDTSGREMNEYINEVESVSNRPGFFPRPLNYKPLTRFQAIDANTDFDRRGKPSVDRDAMQDYYYGRCSFFYQITYDQEQFDRFIDTPEDQMWPLLERAFAVPEGTWATPTKRFAFRMQHVVPWLLNYPLYVINVHFRNGSMLYNAQKIHDKWLMCQQRGEIHDRIRSAGKLFSNRLYGYELSRLLRARLAGEKISYVIQGTSHVFGNLRVEGQSRTAVDPITDRMDRVIDLDRSGPRQQSDALALISETNVDVQDPTHLMLNFTITGPEEPHSLFFRLVEYRSWKLPRPVGERFYLNTDHIFAAGPNSLMIDDQKSFLSEFVQRMQPDSEYELVMAYSRDGRTWGPIKQIRIPPLRTPPKTTPAPPTPPERPRH